MVAIKMLKLKKHYNLLAVVTLVIFYALQLCFLQSVCYAKSDRETPVVRTVKKVTPAVVNISSHYQVEVNPFSGFGIDPFFERFFRDFSQSEKAERTSLGSGVIIDGERGFILTNAHVLSRADDITVTLFDKKEFTARIVGADPSSDLAVLQIKAEDRLPFIDMGRSEDLMIGETVIAIGNPFGFSHTVTVGVISATDRTVRTEKRVYENFIQIDASINPGNSGGPLLNIDGDLIGINTAIYSDAQGIGFAIPIDNAKKIVSDLIRYGEVVPAWLGLFVQDIDQKLAFYLGLKNGVIVKDLEPGPALKAGIQSGDIITSIAGKPLIKASDYISVMKNFSDKDTIDITAVRNGQEIKFSVKASVYPKERAAGLALKLMGIEVKDFKGKGVYISKIKKDCFLDKIGVTTGDIIRQIDEITVENTNDFNNAIVKYRLKDSVVILLQRGSKRYYITVKM